MGKITRELLKNNPKAYYQNIIFKGEPKAISNHAYKGHIPISKD